MRLTPRVRCQLSGVSCKDLRSYDSLRVRGSPRDGIYWAVASPNIRQRKPFTSRPAGPPLSGQLEHTPVDPPPEKRTRATGETLPVRSVWRARVIRVVRISGLAYLGTVAVLFSLQTRMIFPGADTQGQPFAEVRARPGTEFVNLKTSRGERVVALYGGRSFPAASPTLTSPGPTMIFFYGNAMCLNYATGQLEEFRRLGLNVLDSRVRRLRNEQWQPFRERMPGDGPGSLRLPRLHPQCRSQSDRLSRLVAGRSRRHRPGLGSGKSAG